MMKSTVTKSIAVFLFALPLVGIGAAAADQLAPPAKPPGSLVIAEGIVALMSRDPPINATPLGLEVGYANLAGIVTRFGTQVTWTQAGTNVHTRGPMYESDGTGLGIDGLKSARLIFDPKNTIQGVIMTFPRGPSLRGATADMAKSLGKKYKLVSQNFDKFLDYGSFRFEKGDSVILVDSPHLSFEMSVVYVTKALYNANAKKEADEERDSKDRKDKML